MSYAAEVITRQVTGEIRAWLARLQVPANEVARQLGWSQSYISRRLTGEIPLTAAEVAQIGDAIGVHPGVFFDGPDLPGDEDSGDDSPGNPDVKPPRSEPKFRTGKDCVSWGASSPVRVPVAA